MTPITTIIARKWAARLQLSNEQTEIINLQRLHALAKCLKKDDVGPYAQKITDDFCDDFPVLPSKLTSAKLQQIESLIEANDELSYVVGENTLPLPASSLVNHIHSLRVICASDDIVDSELDVIEHLCSIIKQVHLLASKPNKRLFATLTAIKHLEKLSFTNCQIDDNTFVNLSFRQFNHLAELHLNGCSPSSFTAESIATFIMSSSPRVIQKSCVANYLKLSMRAVWSLSMS